MIARLSGIAYHLPEAVLDNERLAIEHPDWDVPRIAQKVGIHARRIAAPDESAGDLGLAAAEKLLAGMGVDRSSIDCLLFCTQSPDYFLPTTACLLQDRLGLSTDTAALDFNQGCSGYVYGLHLAKALVASGEARRVLLITGETYSKYIHPDDRSVRMLFGDAGSASLVTADLPGARLGPTVLGTDGSGFDKLIVAEGASRPNGFTCRPGMSAEAAVVGGPGAEHLYMDGPELFKFTLQRVPQIVQRTLARAELTTAQVDWWIFHQANAFMNTHLRTKLGVPAERAPLHLADIGNTVSSTIPIALHRSADRILDGQRVMLVGFGVGYSWGAGVLDWERVAIV